MSLLLIVQFIIAVVLLNKLADWFARATAMVAELTGMPRLWIGAIMAGFAASIPEKVVSCVAAWQGHGEAAICNGIGSVTFNCVLMGIFLVNAKTPANITWFRDHGIPMLLSCVILFAFALTGAITWPIGLFFVLFCVLYVVWSIITAKREPLLAKEAEEIAGETLDPAAHLRHRWTVALVLLGIGSLGIWLTSKWVLYVAIEMARQCGVGESVIGLTALAIGTSLPELAATIAATRRGHYDTSLGLMFGSNIFVGMGAVGLSSLFGRLPVTTANILFDLPVMMILMIFPFLPLLVGKVPGRVTGYILLISYAAYFYSLFTFYGVFI